MAVDQKATSASWGGHGPHAPPWIRPWSTVASLEGVGGGQTAPGDTIQGVTP